MRRILCGLFLFCSVAACKKGDITAEKNFPENNGYQEYIIPKGGHYANGNNYRRVNKNPVAFMARFDSSCIYSNAKPENAADINKLYGFSDCSSRHQVNSARVGWLWNGSAIELYAYCYSEGKRSSKLLGIVQINKEVALSIAVEAGKYIFTMNDRQETMARACSDENAGGYQLYPYFGGDEAAPHDVHVFIKDF